MDANYLLLGGAVLLGLYMAWNIGANDVANSMADAVGSKSITLRNAVIAAAICEFLGAVLVGSSVTDTIRKGIIKPEVVGAVVTDGDVSQPAQRSLGSNAGNDAAAAPIEMSQPATKLALGMTCALFAAAIWLHAASSFGMPVSTTHSIVGAVAGVGIVAFGASAIDWWVLAQIVASWFISPVAGGLLACLLFTLIRRAILVRPQPASAALRFAPLLVLLVAFVMSSAIFHKGLQNLFQEASTDWRWLSEQAVWVSISLGLVAMVGARFYLVRRLRSTMSLDTAKQLQRVEVALAPIVVLTSCCVAFSHGANDVANSIGPLAAVVDIVSNGTIEDQVPVPFWVLCLGGAGIAAGLAMYGYRVMHTVGSRITDLTPSCGIAADVSATAVVLLCSRWQLPVSTTHTLVGAILGVGLARGLGSVNQAVTRNIFGGWLLTVPAAAGVAMLLYSLAAVCFL